jgi:hypothetical protein
MNDLWRVQHAAGDFIGVNNVTSCPCPCPCLSQRRNFAAFTCSHGDAVP